VGSTILNTIRGFGAVEQGEGRRGPTTIATTMLGINLEDQPVCEPAPSTVIEQRLELHVPLCTRDFSPALEQA
jgi:hypothetical protein